LYCVTAGANGSEFYFGGGFSRSFEPDWSFFASPNNGKLAFWRVGNHSSEAPAMEINRSSLLTTFYGGHQNASDASLKTPDPPAASSDEALQMLKEVEARVYKRLDLPGTGSRLGFLAQEVSNAAPTSWANLVGQTTIADTPGGEEREVQTVDYARLSAVLWQCCRSMLARIEALEARLP